MLGNEVPIHVMSSYALGPEWVANDGITPKGFKSAAGHSTVGQIRRDREGRCAAKNHTCKGFRTKTSIYCAGHEKALAAK